MNNLSKNENSKTFKQQREEKKKAAEASPDTRPWNSLYMHPDTIVANIAQNREADDPAVRIALGETQVILDTKKALTNVAVNVESLDLEELANARVNGVKRSNHVLLMKNLPFSLTENELARMFGKFGSLDKIILPPTKSLALIVFLEQAEARAAFRGLAYKRYKDAPLFLEWAPSNVLSQSSTSKYNEMNRGIGGNVPKRLILRRNVERISDVVIHPGRVEARSLFVKNLNFRTTDNCLRRHFGQRMREGRILSVKVKHWKDGKNVSSGFGFVEFDSTDTARNVCRDLQCTVLDRHVLILQRCRVKNDGHVRTTVEKDKSPTKFLVRNVVFEAEEEELEDLFSPFGTEIESAKAGESLDELKARTAPQFSEHNGIQNATMLCKKRKHTSILDEGNMKFEMIVD